MTEHSTSQTQDETQHSASGGGHVWFKDWLLLLTVPAVLTADQLTKLLIRSNMRLGESWPQEGFVRLTYGTNTGTAFGLLPNQTVLLVVASIIAIGFLIYFYRAHALPRPILRFAIGLQLGGAFGNLFDRVVSGSVVDFIDVGPWPIFNLADSSIVVGMVLLIGVLLMNERRDRSVEEPENTNSGNAKANDQ